MRATLKLTYSHISIIRKYNLKSHNRFANADRYIAQHNFEQIKTYKDFCTKTKEAENVQLTLSEQEEESLRETYMYQRKGAAWTKELGMPAYRLDDHQLQQPIGSMTLVSLTKQAIKQRKAHQLLPFIFVVAAAINLWLYFAYWFGVDNEDYVANVSLNSEFTETFNLPNFQPYIKEYKRKMGVQLQEILAIPGNKTV